MKIQLSNIQCLARNKLCPLGKELIEKYIPNYTIRALAEAALAHPQEEGPSEEAQQLFQKAKDLTEQSNHEAAVPMLLEALQLSPSYEKAQAYLDFCLQRTSKPVPEPVPSLRKRDSIEDIHKVSAPQNSKEAYIHLLLVLLEEPEIQKHETLSTLFEEQVEELMTQEAFTQKQQECYTWTQKLFIDHRVSTFVAKKLQTLHAGSQAPSPSSQPPKVFPKLVPAPLANPSPIQPRPKEVMMPDSAFGKAKWAQYFGDIGIEPPLPANIHDILNATCPIFSGKLVHETHLLTLIPQTLNSQPLTLQKLGELVQRPLQGPATKYRYFSLGQYNDQPTARSHWTLLSGDVIPNSRSKNYAAQQQVAAAFGGYEISNVLDTAVTLFMEHVQSGTKLYSNSPLTYARCQDKYSANYQLAVGDFAAGGLNVGGYNDCEHNFIGVRVSRKFF
jgi:hypothetical protein